jgi:hypothetical protein
MWGPILKRLNRDHDIGMRFNETSLEVSFSNRSTIKLLGLDATSEEQKKVVGQAYRFAVLDEVQDFKNANVQSLISDDLGPAMADCKGTLAMTGTPSNARAFFYEVTRPEEELRIPGWSVHHWTALTTPHIEWQYEIERLREKDPHIEHTAGFQQSYLGQWVFDTTLLCYPNFGACQVADALPQLRPDDSWTFVLGLDFGFCDDTAWVVGAYNAQEPKLWMVYAEKQTKLDVDAIIQRTGELILKHGVVRCIADSGGIGRTICESITNRLQFQIEPADKTDKEQHIRLLDGEMRSGQIGFLPGANDLQEELMGLSWDRKKMEANGQHVEDAACPNHASDAMIYMWRKCFHYSARRPPGDTPRAALIRGDDLPPKPQLDHTVTRLVERTQENSDDWRELKFEETPLSRYESSSTDDSDEGIGW